MLNFKPGRVALAAFLAISGQTANAATFIFDGTIADIFTSPGISPGNPVLAPLGSPASVTFEIDDSDPTLAVLDPDPVSGIFTASVTASGYFDGTVTFVDYLSSFSLTNSYIDFISYGPTQYDDTGSFPITVPDGYHRFRANFGAPLASAPATVGEVVSALEAPGTFGFFRHEAVFVDPPNDLIGTVLTRVDFPSEVPLPAAGWLLLAGVAGLGFLRRKAA